MSSLLTEKVVAALPGVLTPSTIYFVRVGTGFDIYVTNDQGQVVAYPLNNPAYIDLIEPNPAAPGADITRLFRRKKANRNFPGFIGASGSDSSLQPSIFGNKIGLWLPAGNAATAPGVFGYPVYNPLGGSTARNVAVTNFFTRLRRLGYVSATTAGSFGGVRQAAAQFSVGNGAGLGGFFKVCRFGCSDAAPVAGARQFVGMAPPGVPTNVEPSTRGNVIGVGNGAADTTLQLFYGGTTPQAPIDLGVNFPANTLSVDAYELALFSPPGLLRTIHYEVTRLNTGHVASGTLSGTAVEVPGEDVLLTAMEAWRCNNATALAVGLDIIGDYIETDN